MRVYISGPMTGMPDYNFPAFFTAADRLKRAGLEVENPAGADPAKPWQDYLREDLRLLLDCDGVATLPGWQNSRGAKLEVHVAAELGMDVRTLDDWAARPDRGACWFCGALTLRRAPDGDWSCGPTHDGRL